MERQTRYWRCRNFDEANKPSKLLAWQLRKRRHKKIINKLKVADKIIVNPKEISKIFESFYKNLYDNEENKDLELVEYIKETHLPKISKEKINMINEPITTTEIKEVIKKMKVGKSLGPDGLPSEFYKKLEEVIVPHLKNLMNNIIEREGEKCQTPGKERILR